ncbi:hypothetical protein CYMTET_18058 [Cymbomonas tetramitiformis]|uniref:Uncharacterized protein n=1 Tax=Cymbomonas tetramitiformis TaxID=36881 RepID=A0AAE0G8P7_9CHLO|nr:hypothetical protein CYMTET_18058 [Cymbomonas tetramitiformis]
MLHALQNLIRVLRCLLYAHARTEVTSSPFRMSTRSVTRVAERMLNDRAGDAWFSARDSAAVARWLCERECASEPMRWLEREMNAEFTSGRAALVMHEVLHALGTLRAALSQISDHEDRALSEAQAVLHAEEVDEFLVWHEVPWTHDA